MDQKKTSPYLSRYERAKVISIRAQQLSIGKQPQIEVDSNNINHLEIALQELKEKKIPNNIIRKLPDNTIEIWAAKDLVNLYD
jgi:DNA-directed RNA polymerase I, II, and III subunit RPABC2